MIKIVYQYCYQKENVMANNREKKAKRLEMIQMYIEECQRQDKSISEKSEIYTHLSRVFAKEGISISRPSFYKYLDELGFYLESPKKYGFVKESKHYFDEYLEYVGFSNHICFRLKEHGCMGSMIAETINAHYYRKNPVFRKYLCCVALGELLICFYKKSTEKSITREHLKTEIPQVLGQYFVDKVK